MPSNAKLHLFLERIMHMQASTLGGASAGIIGSPGNGSDTMQQLKFSAIKFSQEYSKPLPMHTEIIRLEREMVGYFQILQLMHVLSANEVDRLITNVQALSDQVLNTEN